MFVLEIEVWEDKKTQPLTYFIYFDDLYEAKKAALEHYSIKGNELNHLTLHRLNEK